MLALADRRAFEQLIGRQNKYWHERGFFLELVIWEDFLDAMSPTRLQDLFSGLSQPLEAALGPCRHVCGKMRHSEIDCHTWQNPFVSPTGSIP
jgi:hypothetical protein